MKQQRNEVTSTIETRKHRDAQKAKPSNQKLGCSR